MWQALHEELAGQGFTCIAIALDSGGPAKTEQWIRAAKPTYPCLIDERHLTAELYGVVNVPMGVWIDETGRIVRPAETAATSDAFRRHLDRTTKQMSAEGLAERERVRGAYLHALRDWAAAGSASAYALPEDTARRRLPLPAEARRLHPESWSYRRQTWELEEPGKAGGLEFWAAVDALGDKPYYSPTVLKP